MVLFISTIGALLGLALFVSARPVRRDDEQLTVYTANGPITGHYAVNASSVVEYLGIPYAKPPVGDLRWAPPGKYTASSHYEASKWGDECPYTVSKPVDYPSFTPQAQQIVAYFASGVQNSQSEDCLTLNIWTKSTKTSSLKPVIVFFYGGRFAAGTTHSPFYNAQYFVNNTEVIFVTVNYRTNIFGFPGAPGLPYQNLGLRDQRLAVKWIRDNIVAFGGDYTRISIMGQSAGAVAVDYWSYSYVDDPIAGGLISDSGNAFSFGLLEANVTTSNWYNVSETLGCGSSGDTVACMRTKDWTDIKAAVAKVRPDTANSPLRTTPPFYPVIDNETVFGDYLERSKAGRFAKIPYLLGNNNYEQGIYKISAYAAGNNVTEAQSTSFLLSSFTCPNAFEAESRTAAGIPVWRYRYFGDWENTRLYENSTFNPGGSQAYHGSELEMIFGNSEDISGLPMSQDQRWVSDWMQRAWAGFASDPENGLGRIVGWPRFVEGKETLAVIAEGNRPRVEFVTPEVYSDACAGVQLSG